MFVKAIAGMEYWLLKRLVMMEILSQTMDAQFFVKLKKGMNVRIQGKCVRKFVKMAGIDQKMELIVKKEKWV